MKNPVNQSEITSDNCVSAYLQTSTTDDINIPVVKIDFQGKILYANGAAFISLRDWLCTANDYLPEYFFKTHPEILTLNTEISITLVTRTATLKFDVVPFKESGFIGLYGFENGLSDLIEHHQHSNKNS